MACAFARHDSVTFEEFERAERLRVDIKRLRADLKRDSNRFWVAFFILPLFVVLSVLGRVYTFDYSASDVIVSFSVVASDYKLPLCLPSALFQPQNVHNAAPW